MKKILLIILSFIFLSCSEDQKVNVYDIDYFKSINIPKEYRRSTLFAYNGWDESLPDYFYEYRHAKFKIEYDKKLLVSARSEALGFHYYFVGNKEEDLFLGFYIRWKDGKYLTDTTDITTNLKYTEVKKLLPTFRAKYKYKNIESLYLNTNLLKEYIPDSIIIKRKEDYNSNYLNTTYISKYYNDKFWQTFIKIPQRYINDVTDDPLSGNRQIKYYKGKKIYYLIHKERDSAFLDHLTTMDSLYGVYYCYIPYQRGFYIKWKRLNLENTSFINAPEIYSDLPEKYLKQLYPNYIGKVNYKVRDFDFYIIDLENDPIIRYRNDTVDIEREIMPEIYKKFNFNPPKKKTIDFY